MLLKLFFYDAFDKVYKFQLVNFKIWHTQNWQTQLISMYNFSVFNDMFNGFIVSSKLIYQMFPPKNKNKLLD